MEALGGTLTVLSSLAAMRLRAAEGGKHPEKNQIRRNQRIRSFVAMVESAIPEVCEAGQCVPINPNDNEKTDAPSR